MIPGNNGPVFIDAGTLIDYKCEAIVFPRHLVLPRELNADGLSDGLRQKRSVI
jgi:hypothetical protein